MLSVQGAEHAVDSEPAMRLSVQRQEEWTEQQAEEREYHEQLAAKIARDHGRAVARARQLLALGNAGVIIDTETTDIDGYAVEICVLSLHGEVLFTTLLNPQEPIAEGARRVHGITDEEVAGAPRFADVLPQLEQQLQGRTIIAFQAGFDNDVLAREVRRLMPKERRPLWKVVPWLDVESWECAMHLAAQYLGNWNEKHSSYTWPALPGASHRAQGDALALLRLLQNMSSDRPIYSGEET